MNLLQTLQNRAARLVRNKDRYTPVRDLLISCGWLSIRQLVAFHRVLLLFNIKQKGKPQDFAEYQPATPHPKWPSGSRKSLDPKLMDPPINFR